MSKQGTVEKFVLTLNTVDCYPFLELCEYGKNVVANIAMSMKLHFIYLIGS